jgi:hypothetical protein
VQRADLRATQDIADLLAEVFVNNAHFSAGGLRALRISVIMQAFHLLRFLGD